MRPTTSLLQATTRRPTPRQPFLRKNSIPARRFEAVGVFQSCLDAEGYEFIGIPFQEETDPEAPVNQQPYIDALVACAARSQIQERLAEADAARADLTAEEVENQNRQFIAFRDPWSGGVGAFPSQYPTNKASCSADSLRPHHGSLPRREPHDVRRSRRVPERGGRLRWGRLMSRSQIMGAFVALALVAGLVIVWQVTGEEESGDSPIEILTDSVGRQTLRDELTLNGELRRDELSTINSPFDGRVSQVGIADGDEIAAGDVILSLDGRPAVAANGDFSFYRALDVGSDGPDVLQLERILSEAGYDPGNVDRLYTEATRAALRNWQIDYGYGGATPEPEETIIISLQPSNGYQVGDKDTKAILIGPSVPVPGDTLVASGGGAGIIPFQDDSITAIGVQSTEATITEGDTLNVVLTANPAPVVDTQIQLAFGGDATGGDLDDVADPDIDVDYLDDPLEDSPIVWPANAATVTLTLETFTDTVDEEDETWTISITPEQPIGGGINYDPAPLNTLTVTIEDATPDEVPTFELTIEAGDDEIDEGEVATYTVTADRELGRPVEVRYSLTGTATEVDDYDEQDTDPSFVFPAGADETTVTIATVQDTTIEPTESLTMTLQPSDDPTDEYLLGSSISGTVRIQDEDEPELTIVGSEVRAAEGGAVASRSAPTRPPAAISPSTTRSAEPQRWAPTTRCSPAQSPSPPVPARSTCSCRHSTTM